jgi:hypothetical protein
VAAKWYAPYERLRSCAVVALLHGDELSSEKVYYSAREPLRSVQRERTEEGPECWRGKVKRGDCTDVSDPSCAQPRKLSGRTILFACQEKPGPGTTYHRSNTHQGTRGLLMARVNCEIAQTYVYGSSSKA